MFLVEAPTMTRPRRLGIGFDLETWDFYITEDHGIVAKLEIGDSQALLEQIRQALGKGERP